MLDGTQVMALCRNATAQPLSDCLDTVDSPQGRSRVTAFLRSQPYQHYEPAPDAPGLLIRTDADGSKTRGRFVNRQFKAVRSVE